MKESNNTSHVTQNRSVANENTSVHQELRQSKPTYEDKRPEVQRMVQLQAMMYNSPQAMQHRELQQVMETSPVVQQRRALQGMADNSTKTQRSKALQLNADTYYQKAKQLQSHSSEFSNSTDDQKIVQNKENKTGLPNDLKTGVENLSGYSMGDVKVHYNSSQPAQLNAHAYAQGTDIHLASGQEKHLPHEAWHVVQQKQGRVQPTKQMKGKIAINDDEALEKEADIMGAKSLQLSSNESTNEPLKTSANSKGSYQLVVDETYCKGILGDLFDDLNNPEYANQTWSEDGSLLLDIVSLSTIIYGFLGMDYDSENAATYTKTKIDDEDIADERFTAQNADYTIEGGTGAQNVAAYQGGDYFHIVNHKWDTDKEANKRMILNLKHQTDAHALMKHLLKLWDSEDANWSNHIEVAKFRASKTTKEYMKYDKVVIYYLEKPISGKDAAEAETAGGSDITSAIHNGIMSFLNGMATDGDGAKLLNENINAFYNKIGKGVGVGPEGEPGSSFTLLTATLIASEILNHTFLLKGAKKDFVDYLYQVVTESDK